jgi:hypothetical protein
MKEIKLKFYLGLIGVIISSIMIGTYISSTYYVIEGAYKASLFDWGFTSILIVVFGNLMIKSLRKIILLEFVQDLENEKK